MLNTIVYATQFYYNDKCDCECLKSYKAQKLISTCKCAVCTLYIYIYIYIYNYDKECIINVL